MVPRYGLTITSSTSKARGPINEGKNVAAAENQLESMGYRLTQERGRWPFLTPRLENATDKTRKNAPPLIKQIWEFLEGQLEHAYKPLAGSGLSQVYPTTHQADMGIS